jgi:hypothetical protein
MYLTKRKWIVSPRVFSYEDLWRMAADEEKRRKSMNDLSEHNRKLQEAELQKTRDTLTWCVPESPAMPEIHAKGFSFAEDVNSTFFNELSKTQLLAVLGAYEAGKL